MENITNVKKTENKKTSFDKFLAGLPIFWESELKEAISDFLRALLLLFGVLAVVFALFGLWSLIIPFNFWPEWAVVSARVTLAVVFASFSSFFIFKLIKHIMRLGSSA